MTETESESRGQKRGLQRTRPQRLCNITGCTKQVQQGGVCCQHGAKTRRSPCSKKWCTNFSQRGGLCRRHGAFELETCRVEGCKRIAKEGQLCDQHRTSSEDTKSANTDKTTEPIYTNASCSTGIEGWIENEALMDDAILNDMGMMSFQTSTDENSIREVEVSDLEILAMYMMATEDFQRGTCGI
jgi:hypothetical protein